METDGITYDFGLDDPAVELVDGSEDADDQKDMLPVMPDEPCNESSGNDGDDGAEVRNDAEDGDGCSDGKGVGQPDEVEDDRGEGAINEADEHLASEEGDDIAVDFLDGGDDFFLESGLFDGENIVPVFLDGTAFREEVEEEDGSHDESDRDADPAEDSFATGGEPGGYLGEESGSVEIHANGKLLLRRGGRTHLLKFFRGVGVGVHIPQAFAVEFVDGAGDHGFFHGSEDGIGGGLPDLSPVVDEFIRLVDERGNDPQEEDDDSECTGAHYSGNGKGTGNFSSDQPVDKGLKKIGDDCRNDDGQEYGFKEAEDMGDEQDGSDGKCQNNGKGDAGESVPACLLTEVVRGGGRSHCRKEAVDRELFC